MQKAIQDQLSNIQFMVKGLTDHEYTLKLDIFSGSSLGQHIRHILELYLCLVDSLESGVVCYDNRKRDTRMETDRSFASNIIDSIINKVNAIKKDKALKLIGDFSCESENVQELKTSIYRELAYNLEHGVHHQAIIKIGIKHINREELINSTFGVAPSTIKYQNLQFISTIKLNPMLSI